MSDFNPGEEWLEVTESQWLATPIDDDHIEFVSGGKVRHWVRVAPVPPLPTAPYTVIRAWWGTELYTVLTLSDEGEWKSSLKSVYDAEDLAQMVRFEVLSEPRAVTAKAVLDRLAEITAPENILTGGAYHDTAREFGVES